VSEPVTSPEPAASRPDSTRTGPGRLLIAVYGLFALSASARAGVQIATNFGHAPVAYLLSAFAGVVYILATVTLANGSPAARRIAVVSCSIELVGVIAIGTWSILDRATFPDATVWSGYGSGYGFVPLVLPVFGLLWLRRWSRRPGTGRTIAASAGRRGAELGNHESVRDQKNQNHHPERDVTPPRTTATSRRLAAFRGGGGRQSRIQSRLSAGSGS
jgi:hypothetical protein